MTDTSYDQTPYPVVAFAETHPRRLHAIAHLLGVEDPPPPQRCRVLELGCAVGGNIVPMGYSLPGATFVGIDLSAAQIACAAELASAVGVENVELRTANLTEVTPQGWGRFDYIICHGIWSWVPPEVGEKILQICGEQLSDRGVAYVSFNTYPGWRSRQWLREAMLFHTQHIREPSAKARAARELTEALATSPFLPADKIATLEAELRYVRDKPDSYILHDYLEPDNNPVYFRDFAALARRHGLRYLADAKQNGAAELAWPPLRDWVRRGQDGAAPAGDADADDEVVIRAEQYVDFAGSRMFRRAVLCRADVRVDRPGAAARLEGLSGETLLRQWAAGGGATRFEHPNGTRYVTGSPAVRQALATVSGGFPRAVPLRGLLGDPATREEVAAALLHCWGIGILRLYADPPVFAAAAGPSPRASAIARRLAPGGQVVNLRHETTTLAPEHRTLLPLLDGTRMREQLAQDTHAAPEVVERALAQLAAMAVLEQ